MSSMLIVNIRDIKRNCYSAKYHPWSMVHALAKNAKLWPQTNFGFKLKLDHQNCKNTLIHRRGGGGGTA